MKKTILVASFACAALFAKAQQQPTPQQPLYLRAGDTVIKKASIDTILHNLGVVYQSIHQMHVDAVDRDNLDNILQTNVTILTRGMPVLVRKEQPKKEKPKK